MCILIIYNIYRTWRYKNERKYDFQMVKQCKKKNDIQMPLKTRAHYSSNCK